MTRPAIAIALLLSAILMMRGLAGDWHRTSLVKLPAARQTAPDKTSIPPDKSLIPPVPATLPDLRTGYLFNQERMLANPKTAADSGDKGVEADFEVKPGLGVSIDQLTYAGSLIAQGFTRAVVVYPSPKETHAAQPRPIAGRPPARPSQSGDEHAQLGVGDEVDGYTLAKIEPSKLIFTKGEDTVEKPLYDATKKRLPPPPKPPAAGPARPPGQLMPGIHPVIGPPAASDSAAQSSPSVSMGTGGGSSPPAGPFSFGGPSSFGLPAPAPAIPAPMASASPASGITVSSPLVSNPAPGVIGAAGGGQTPMTLPIRRMIIPIQPPPDTSRVNRGGEGNVQAVPLSPTAIPGNNASGK